MTAALSGALVLSSLTGCACNKQIMDFKYEFNKAIIVHDNCATIIDVKKWCDYEGEQIQIITKDGTIIITSTFDTKLINDIDSDLTAEDIAKSLVGEDGEINYLGKEQSLTLSKNN